MSIIDEIKLYVKHGKFPIVQDESKNYRICENITEQTGEICSSFGRIIKKDLQLGGGRYWNEG